MDYQHTRQRSNTKGLGTLSRRTDSPLEMSHEIWSTLPNDICLSIVARLSWNEISRLSCIWKQLREALVHHKIFFQEYAGSRLQKPICVLQGSLPWQLKYRMIAGDGADGHTRHHNLLISRARDVPARHNDVQQLICKFNPMVLVIRSLAAGCFVLVIKETWDSIGEISSVSVCLNPTNGTARQICFDDHRSQLAQRFTNRGHIKGIFTDGESHYQILAALFVLDEDGNLTYDQKIPRSENLGGGAVIDEADFFNYCVFYLYSSRTKAWTELLDCNISRFANFLDPVVYQGAIHALLAIKSFGSIYFQLCFVDEIYGRKRWIPFAVPFPSTSLLSAHIFTFQGELMLAGRLQRSAWIPFGSSNFADSQTVCIWKLCEEPRTWVVVSCMPEHITKEITHSCWSKTQSCSSFCTNSDYLILRGHKGFHSPVSRGSHCVVMYNIATSFWQVVHMHEDKELQADYFTFFEPRFDISA